MFVHSFSWKTWDLLEEAISTWNKYSQFVEQCWIHSNCSLQKENVSGLIVEVELGKYLLSYNTLLEK